MGYNALASHEKCDLVPLPEDKNAIGNKFILKIECKAEGEVACSKAHLVA